MGWTSRTNNDFFNDLSQGKISFDVGGTLRMKGYEIDKTITIPRECVRQLMAAKTILRDEHGIELIIIDSGMTPKSNDRGASRSEAQPTTVQPGDLGLMDPEVSRTMESPDKQPQPTKVRKTDAQPQPTNDHATEEQEKQKGSFTDLNDAHVMYNSFFKKRWRERVNLDDTPSFSQLHDRLQERLMTTTIIKRDDMHKSFIREENYFGSTYTVVTLDEWITIKRTRQWGLSSRLPWKTIAFHASPRHALEHRAWLESSRHKNEIRPVQIMSLSRPSSTRKNGSSGAP